MIKRISFLLFALLMFAIYGSSAFAIGSDVTRKTLTGLKGVYVVVENLQPNIEKYASKFNLTKEQIQADVEGKLKGAGIEILSRDRWLKTTGRPMLYVNINTHEYEKYWYSYTISIDLQQIVMLETNPEVKTFATTWSIEMTGIANIGTLGHICSNVATLIDRFIEAHKSVNPKKQ
ncbi:MAG TPA: hypothetical protein DDW17_02455 [Deltaproteobacteria bacterium]|nr:hypothetical protein [Deltaproteobacteria bacterium]